MVKEWKISTAYLDGAGALDVMEVL